MMLEETENSKHSVFEQGSSYHCMTTWTKLEMIFLVLL